MRPTQIYKPNKVERFLANLACHGLVNFKSGQYGRRGQSVVVALEFNPT